MHKQMSRKKTFSHINKIFLEIFETFPANPSSNDLNSMQLFEIIVERGKTENLWDFNDFVFHPSKGKMKTEQS